MDLVYTFSRDCTEQHLLYGSEDSSLHCGIMCEQNCHISIRLVIAGLFAIVMNISHVFFYFFTTSDSLHLWTTRW